MSIEQEVVDKKMLRLKGIVAVYAANSSGDDIEIYADEERQEVQCRFFGLRQQAEKENDSEPYMCISDFIAPKQSGVPDYLGLFANGTFGVEKMVEKFKSDVRTLIPQHSQRRNLKLPYLCLSLLMLHA